jgi:hypothetical protein
MTAPAPTTTRGPRWLRALSGGAIAAAVVAVVVSAWSPLLANNPAYLATLVVASLIAGALLVSGLRRRRPPRPGALRRTFRVLAALAGVGLAALVLWLRPFPAEQVALDALASDEDVTVTDTRTRTIFEPVGVPQAGFVLYPGARVDPRAYAALAHDISRSGVRVVVLKCPFDLALLCPGAADSYISPDLAWSVGGHSLGGVVAASYAASTPDATDANGSSDSTVGLVLWASYSIDDLSGRTDVPTTSIYGSNDARTTPADVDGRRDLLPVDTTYVRIDGGIHAFFGDYGSQPGDGEPGTSREDAQAQILGATLTALGASETAS